MTLLGAPLTVDMVNKALHIQFTWLSTVRLFENIMTTHFPRKKDLEFRYRQTTTQWRLFSVTFCPSHALYFFSFTALSLDGNSSFHPRLSHMLGRKNLMTLSFLRCLKSALTLQQIWQSWRMWAMTLFGIISQVGALLIRLSLDGEDILKMGGRLLQLKVIS